MEVGIKKASEAAGSVIRLAELLGVTRNAIYQWERIPAERVVEVEKLTGVPREQLRPDLYL